MKPAAALTASRGAVAPRPAARRALGPPAHPLAPAVPCPRASVVAAAVYKVTFRLPDGSEQVVDCADDTYILDAAEAAGLDLPYSCHGGTCNTCTCKVLEGTLDQSEQSYLDEKEVEQEKFALICSSYPTSDLVFLTHQQDALQDFEMAEMQAEQK